MDKAKIVEMIVEKWRADHAAVIDAAKATHEAATNEESKPENEYDTRALENSYLAGAQAKRAGEIEEILSMYKFLNLRTFTAKDPIAPTALLELEFQGKKLFVFLAPLGGGMSVTSQGKNVQVITPASPLGEALLSLKVGDIAVIENGDTIKEYDILNIW